VNSESRTRQDLTGFALCGALAGTALVFVLEASGIFSDRFDDVDPFIHIMTEMAIFVGGGAMLFAAIAEMRNRRGRSEATTDSLEGSRAVADGRAGGGSAERSDAGH
jgi:hypothetical protein